MVEKPKSSRYGIGIARKLRRTQTEAEEILWSHIRNRQLDAAKFRRQHPIGRYIADFYCHSAGLVIEIDGGIHSESSQAEYDGIREEILNQGGLTVLRLSNEQLLNDIEAALDVIRSHL